MSEENISGLPLDSNFNKMKVVDIRKILRAKGLSAEGNKSDLIQRLTEHYSSTPKKSFSSSEAGVFDEDLEKSPVNEDTLMKSLTDDEEEMAVEDEVGSKDAEPSIEEEDDEELVTQEEQEVDDGEGGQESPANNKRKMQSDMAEGQTGEGETTQAISSGSEPRSEGSDLSKNDDTAASTTMTAPATSSSSAKKIIKLSDVSSREKLAKRAEKFGLTEAAKKEIRAARFGIQTPASLGDVLKKRAERFGLPSNTKTSDDDVLKKRAARFGIVAPPSSGKVNRAMFGPNRRKEKELNWPHDEGGTVGGGGRRRMKWMNNV